MGRIFSLIFILISCRSIPSPSSGATELERAIATPAALENLCAKGASAACALVNKDADAKHSLPILQSITSQQQSRFVVVLPKGSRLLYFIHPAAQGSGGAGVTRLNPEHFERPFSDQAVEQVEAFNLRAGVEYELVVAHEDGSLWDRRRFRTLDLQRPRVRIAAISCMDDSLADVALKMWPQVMAQKPDAIFLMGDNVYADHAHGKWIAEATPEVLWNRYVETRERLPIFKADSLIPTFAIWDDHDFGKNDGDRTFPYRDASMDIFYSFFAQKNPAPGFERGPGISFWLTAFGVQFGMLDDRSFRTPDRQDTPEQTHFGADQERWITDHLKAARTPIVLVSGDQFFGGYHKFESYEGSHPKSFQQILNQWRQTRVPLIFISGDRHLSEIIKVPPEALGFPTFEITSSAIHARVFKDAFKENPSPWQLVGVAGQYNYSIVELMRAESGFLQLSVQAFTLEQNMLYQKTLTVKR